MITKRNLVLLLVLCVLALVLVPGLADASQRTLWGLLAYLTHNVRVDMGPSAWAAPLVH
jgi:hypothetical protein